MKIVRVAVANHARIADLEVEVREHAVLVGPNAVGKSTLLRLLDALLGASWSQLVAAVDPSQFRDPAIPMTVEVRLDDLDADDVAYFAEKIQVGTGSDKGQKWLNLRLKAEMSISDPERVDVVRHFVKPLVDDVPVRRDDLRKIGWSFLPASRSPDRDLGSGPTSAVRLLLQAVSLDSTDLATIEKSLAEVSIALKASKALSGLRSDLADELSGLLPEPVSKDELVVDLPSTKSDQPLNDVDILFERSGVRSPLAAQSDGLRSLAVIAVQLLARRSARILAIDEPEMHLHPRGQANLGRLLASAPGQRVLATHAPAVLAPFRPGHAVAVTKHGARQIPTSAFDGDPKRLQHWWVEPALEPLTAERIVFVEGISDRILVNAVARLLGLELDRCGVSVVALNSANNFTKAIELFGPAGFGIRLLGLIDENEAPIPADALEVKEADLSTHDIFTCRADLEEEYVTALGAGTTIELLTRSGLFTDKKLMQMTGAASVAAISASDLASDVLRKRKVEAAAALSETMSSAQAKSLSTVVELVERAVLP